MSPTATHHSIAPLLRHSLFRCVAHGGRRKRDGLGGATAYKIFKTTVASQISEISVQRRLFAINVFRIEEETFPQNLDRGVGLAQQRIRASHIVHRGGIPRMK